MAPEKPDVIARSPERTANQNEYHADVATPFFPTPSATPKPTADAAADLSVPDDGELEVEDMDVGSGEGNAEGKTPWRGPVRTLKGILAMARVSRAESALQAKSEAVQEGSSNKIERDDR